VIAHDVATAEAMPAHQFFEIYKQYSSNLPLAINLKSVGLQKLVREALETYTSRIIFFLRCLCLMR
jgi:hypothetical protein